MKPLKKVFRNFKIGTRILTGLRSPADFVEKSTGLEHISKIKPTDIIIAGYPKSGNTWMQYMLADLFFQIDASEARDEVIQSLVPTFLDSKADNFFRRYADPMFLRSHDFPKPEYRRVICLVRDGRDVLVSYVNYLKLWEEHQKLDAHTMISSEYYNIPPWHVHLAQWVENPYNADILFVRYEDLRADPLGEMEKVCAFSGIDYTEEDIERTIRHTTFEAMREREKKYGWSAQNTGFPQKKGFIRRGKVGSYKDELSETDLSLFLKQAEPMLKHFGYTS